MGTKTEKLTCAVPSYILSLVEVQWCMYKAPSLFESFSAFLYDELRNFGSPRNIGNRSISKALPAPAILPQFSKFLSNNQHIRRVHLHWETYFEEL
jgi:hypothetical protein